MEQEYKQLKKDIEKSFSKIWGKRCEIKDVKQFPDLKKKPEERCMTCRAYDMLDIFMDSLEKAL
jgi:uncharacterized protein (UPF0335 family)